jgi:serine O-acetyltransferase
MLDDLGSLLSTLRSDFQRHKRQFRDLGLYVTGVYHFGVWASGQKNPAARWVGSRLYGLSFLMVELGTGCSIDRTTQIGEGLHIVHPGGIRIHPHTVIGERCGIMNDVTIGTTAKGGTGAPRIGNDVFIGTGARILGPVTIGDGATIAANTLVITDVPAGATIIGVPGRVLPTPRAGAREGQPPAPIPVTERPPEATSRRPEPPSAVRSEPH